MFGKNSRIKALETRKQLLIAESDLNRAQLLQAWQAMAGEVHALARHAKTISAVASAAGLLVAGVSSFRRQKPAAAAEKTSWWRTILEGAGLATSIWSAFRSKDHGPQDK